MLSRKLNEEKGVCIEEEHVRVNIRFKDLQEVEVVVSFDNNVHQSITLKWKLFSGVLRDFIRKRKSFEGKKLSLVIGLSILD